MADGSGRIDVAGVFDFRNPDYTAIFRERARRLQEIRGEPGILPGLKAYYRQHPADFINDWGCTFDPRNVERGLPALVPFILFDKQREAIDYVLRKWRAQQPGLVEKSRDMGMSWLLVATACTLCLFYDGMGIGFGSRKEEYVDRIGSPKSLFYKARLFMRHIPKEFRGGFLLKKHAPFMRLEFPETGATITGEAGDNIGRGDRASIYFVDEAAYLEHPDMVDAALSQTTNCQIDLSSVNGMANAFAQKRHGGKVEVFIFDWRDDPRKDAAWYDKQVDELDPVIVAQEIDRDYAASVEGVVIPGQWVRAAIDAHLKLGVAPTGARTAALDVADEGKDTNAFCGTHGWLIEHIEEWSGKGADIFKTVERTFELCDDNGYDDIVYDADGLGAGVRGDARVINERRALTGARALAVSAFRGSAAVFSPLGEDEKGRKNEDYFKNAKAQGWWALRRRFLTTWRAINGHPFSADNIISISSKSPAYLKLIFELSQPTYVTDTLGKIVIDKTPDGSKSPNLADSVMIRYAPQKRILRISDDTLRKAGRR
jgi:phage terminase large subunit